MTEILVKNLVLLLCESKHEMSRVKVPYNVKIRSFEVLDIYRVFFFTLYIKKIRDSISLYANTQ